MAKYVPYNEAEIERKPEESWTGYFGRVFNNLPIKLFGSPRRDEETSTVDGGLTPTVREILKEMEVEVTPQNTWSERYLDGTLVAFFADIDEACIRAGYTLDTVREKLKVFLAKRKQPDTMEEVYGDFARFLIPVYLELRLMGYNRHDVWG